MSLVTKHSFCLLTGKWKRILPGLDLGQCFKIGIETLIFSYIYKKNSSLSRKTTNPHTLLHGHWPALISILQLLYICPKINQMTITYIAYIYHPTWPTHKHNSRNMIIGQKLSSPIFRPSKGHFYNSTRWSNHNWQGMQSYATQRERLDHRRPLLENQLLGCQITISLISKDSSDITNHYSDLH